MSKTGKTREEVEELKVAWMNDAIWDIEDTEGFEEYREELLAFREAADASGLDRSALEAVFYGNAAAMLERARAGLAGESPAEPGSGAP